MGLGLAALGTVDLQEMDCLGGAVGRARSSLWRRTHTWEDHRDRKADLGGTVMWYLGGTCPRRFGISVPPARSRSTPVA